MISQKEEMRTGTESSGVVLHDMIERIYFYFIIFSQKRNEKRESHGGRGSSWWFARRQAVGHVRDVCPSSMSNPHEKHAFMLLWYFTMLEYIGAVLRAGVPPPIPAGTNAGMPPPLPLLRAV